MTLVPIDTTSEISVITFLQSGVAALSEALDRTDIAGVVNIKAQAATVETATKQLGLSRESQDVATELVRRSEWTLGRAIRKGQDDGLVRSQGEGSKDNLSDTVTRLPSPYDFAKKHELHGTGDRAGIYDLAEISPEQLDAALEEAKNEGNLSRANVARKAGAGKPPVTERNFQEAELVNAFRSMARPLLSPKNVASLSPKARDLLITLLETAIATLKGNDQ